MGKKTQIDGQMSFDFSIDVRNYVVQANALITGKQALKLNSTKLIRSAIMQVVRDDEELKPYIVSIKELADLFGVPANNIYRDIDDITDDIIRNPVYIREEKDGKTTGFAKIPWISRCEYREGVGLAIKLNEDLKPYLISLKDHYTQYTLEEIMPMKSVYSIRIFELLLSKIMYRSIPKGGTEVVLTVQEIRECCDCEDKYEEFKNLRNRVIEGAISEINEKTLYNVEYSYIKKDKSVVAIKFLVKDAIREKQRKK